MYNIPNRGISNKFNELQDVHRFSRTLTPVPETHSPHSIPLNRAQLLSSLISNFTLC